MSQHRSIEVKVGILILVALGLLAGFIVVMGGVTLEPTYRVNVDFANPGGLKAGAPVRLAGIRIGKVTAIEFRGADPKAVADGTLIRVVTELERQYQSSVREDSGWFISTQGVLGEFFLAVEPGSMDKPVLQDEAVVHGVSPPRLDLLLSEAYELLHHTYLGITQNEDKLKETFDGLHRTLKGSGHFFDRNTDKLDRLVDSVESLSVQANEAVIAAREKYVDNPKIDRILSNVEQSSAAVQRDLGPLLSDSRTLVTNMNQLTEVVGSQEQIRRYEQITKDAAAITASAKQTVDDARAIAGRVRQGQGSLGAFVMDEAVYDDLQEFLRDIKHNPWKLFWRD
jgi:phospholipid/cholesterol/gamma-HCH transport system substrate-binding protein